VANKGVLEHDVKRRVELEVLQLRESLEAKGGLSEAEVERKVEEVRAHLLSDLASVGRAVASEGGAGAAGRGETARRNRPATSAWRGWTGAVRLCRPRDPSWFHSGRPGASVRISDERRTQAHRCCAHERHAECFGAYA
jgi:hypothetical protein